MCGPHQSVEDLNRTERQTSLSKMEFSGRNAFTLHLHLQLSRVPHCSHRLASLHICPRQFLKISFSVSPQYLFVCLPLIFVFLCVYLSVSTYIDIVVVVHLLSHVQLFATPGLQHARLPCPSLSHGVCLNSCPLSQ